MIEILGEIIPFIHCYGFCPRPERNPIEEVGYLQYIERICAFLHKAESLGYEIGTPIFIGGARLNGTGLTEAESGVALRNQPPMNQFCFSKAETIGGLNHQECLGLIVERLLKGFHKAIRPIYFVDQVREELVRTMAEKIGVTIGVLGIPRSDTHPNSTVAHQAKMLAKLKSAEKLFASKGR